MATSFYFYDLETSGVNPREARIMQFAGQRTTLDLDLLDDPHNVLVQLPDDVLPEPDAILITGITPQQTKSEGVTEAEFLKLFYEEIATPGTIFVGFNTVRFDDEFMRFLHWRNFYDAYEWQWKDDRSRWDLLDVVRMTRALRPEGINWPVDTEGRPTNRLELLTSLNKLQHSNAHDALSDVHATIDLARLLRARQPKLFDYLLSMRDKRAVQALVDSGQPFVYSSGKYPGEFEKTTLAVKIADHPKQGGALVYDLRHDPEVFAAMTPEQLAEAWQWRPKDDTSPRLPIKTLKYNRCPAVAPQAVLDEQSQERLNIDMSVIEANRKKLAQVPHWPERLFKALEILDRQQQTQMFASETSVDSQLYDSFCGPQDKRLFAELHQQDPDNIESFVEKFEDQRLKALVPLYKARNFPRSLSDSERQSWELHIRRRILDGGQNSRLAKYFRRLEEISKRPRLTQKDHYLIEDLQLYGQSLIQSD